MTYVSNHIDELATFSNITNQCNPIMSIGHASSIIVQTPNNPTQKNIQTDCSNRASYYYAAYLCHDCY